jgi:hypothetical protein
MKWLENNIGDNGNTNYDYYLKGCSLIGNLRDEYLKLKNANRDEDKCSFQLFNEAINNVYNQ